MGPKATPTITSEQPLFPTHLFIHSFVRLYIDKFI